MSATAIHQTGTSDGLQRVVGEIVGPEPGPTLICIGAVHGNEPAGITALQRACAKLENQHLIRRGTFVGIAGNLSALARKSRYLDEDLNRIWTKDRVESDHGTAGPSGGRVAEEHEAREILREIQRASRNAVRDVYIVDLPTTSGDSPPFGLVADTLRNRAFALKFPIPIVLGLEEHLDGTLMEYFNHKGFVTLAFEGGRHDSPESSVLLESCIWMGLNLLEMLDGLAPATSLESANRELQRVGEGYPRVLEVRHHHHVDPEDQFRMEPGFSGFQMVKAGDVIARDRSGEIAAAIDGRVLLPLYQSQGSDGYFLMREFSTFWLSVSAALRRMRLDAILHWLPGVTRSIHDPNTLTINRRVARWFALQVFHLLGYRRRQMDGETLTMTRRPE